MGDEEAVTKRGGQLQDDDDDEGPDADADADAATRPRGGAPRGEWQPGAFAALAVLSVVNLLNYMDRVLPAASKALIQEEFGLSDTLSSFPAFAFIAVYMVWCPVIGHLVDVRLWHRRRLLAAGVFLWSLATVSTAISVNFTMFMLSRLAVGFGEATWITIAPALLSDAFAPRLRNRVLTVFQVATPLGAAVGFIAGGVLSKLFGSWRPSFIVIGAPGCIVALACLAIRDPGRGVYDDPVDVALVGQPWGGFLRDLSRNTIYWLNVAGLVAVIFAVGGMQDWLPEYLRREKGFGDIQANVVTALGVGVGGVAGAVLGGICADVLKAARVTRHPYFAHNAATMALGALGTFGALAVQGVAAVALLFTPAVALLFMYQGPQAAILVNSVGGQGRARAIGIQQFLSHLLGDAISPLIIGAISEVTGSLSFAVYVTVPVMFIVAALLWGLGWRVSPLLHDDDVYKRLPEFDAFFEVRCDELDTRSETSRSDNDEAEELHEL